MVPLLETDRLCLRPLTWDDRELMGQLDADPAAMRFVGTPRSAESSAARLGEVITAYDQLPEGLGRWAVEERTTTTFVGVAVLRPRGENIEVGYRFFPAHWGLGYATEVTRVLLRHGFQTLGLTQIVGVTDPRNAASQHVLQKCGFRLVGEYAADGGPLRYFVLDNPDPAAVVRGAGPRPTSA